MKKSGPARWSTPSYSYNFRRGVIRRRTLPIAIYAVAVSIPMAAAVFLASLQAKPAVALKANQTASVPRTSVVPAHQFNLQPTNSVDYANSQLQAIIDQFAKTHGSYRWGIRLQGLGSDERSAAYDNNVPFRSASVYKLLLMYPLIQRVPMNQWNSVELNVKGNTVRLDKCVTAMLKVSDNNCGKAVGDYVGWRYIDSELAIIGLQKTNINNDNGPVTTAGDVAYYLQGLYEGKWFDGATRDFIIKTLDQQILRQGIPAGCGTNCAVADKTGDLNFVRHDAGIVRYPGGAYVLSIFSSGASYSEIAGLAAQLQTFMVAN